MYITVVWNILKAGGVTSVAHSGTLIAGIYTQNWVYSIWHWLCSDWMYNPWQQLPQPDLMWAGQVTHSAAMSCKMMTNIRSTESEGRTLAETSAW